FNLVDQRAIAREDLETEGPLLEQVQQHRPLRLDGAHNLALLLGVALVTVARGNGWFTGGRPWPFGLQEGVLALLALCAWFTTRPAHRTANRFGFGPIIEVAVLFAGIFTTMTAPLLLLNEHGGELGLNEPWQVFWGTGLLSSMLDNAPTYLAFAVANAGRLGIGLDQPGFLGRLLLTEEGPALLAAISCGAVFMGALTYIGNGPNFMVKAMAEGSGVRMPSFFGYMKWSLAILLPLFGALTLAFFA
ncbi:MAG TPA: sodium:proton antiporter, partial [Planctomycetota bacterium]|nr:sodium:proton antiporter [Planctomycetota bacterium]